MPPIGPDWEIKLPVANGWVGRQRAGSFRIHAQETQERERDSTTILGKQEDQAGERHKTK